MQSFLIYKGGKALKELWGMFYSFFKVGLLTFGGGYTMLPIMQREVVSRGYTTDDELVDYYALGQCVPGAIAINTAAFIGYKRRGLAGALATVSGVVLPSLIIIIIIASFISNFAKLDIVQSAFAGVSAAVAALMVSVLIDMYKKGVTDIWGAILFALAFILSVFFDISPAIIVVGAIVSGLAIYRVKGLV